MPESLGKYELRGVLGKGAMGTVYDGYDPIIARRVAIKTIRLPDAGDQEAQEELARFKREAQAAGRLSHPNIVGVYDYGETAELAYIVMELVEGTSLKQIIDKQERFELAEINRLMEALLAGLQYSHERGVVHRDIKPANIMLTNAGALKISDFGIARIESSSMTQAGTVLGTPAYMSPEQFMGQTVDARTDIYSAGVLLYQLLTGEKPFDGGFTAIMHKVLNTEPPPPSALSVTVPHAFDAVVKQAMAKRPDDRFGAASDFATAIREASAAKTQAPLDFSLGDFGAGDATMVAPARAVPPPPVAPPPSAPGPAAGTPLSGAPEVKKPGPPVALLAVIAAVALAGIGGAVFLRLGNHGAAPAPAAQTAPAPKPVPAPAPAPAPATQAAGPPATPAPTGPALPVLTAAQRLGALSASFGALPCTLLNATDGPPPHLSGVATDGVGRAALAKALAAAPPDAVPTDAVAIVQGGYCNTLDAIRPYHSLAADPAATLTIGLAGGKTDLVENQMITIVGTLPGFATNLEIDYFSSDGTVDHFASNRAANAPLILPIGQVGPPYGTDLIVAIASSRPLFPAPAQQAQTRPLYLPALRRALASLQAAGGQVAVAALPVVTAPAP
jgi:serine/threonine-protein kinase